MQSGYAYDPFGRRLYKAPLDEHGRPVVSAATWSVWDGNRLLQELRALDNHELPRHSLTQTCVYVPESFVPLAQLRTLETLEDDGAQAPPVSLLRVRVPARAGVEVPRSPQPPTQIRYYVGPAERPRPA